MEALVRRFMSVAFLIFAVVLVAPAHAGQFGEIIIDGPDVSLTRSQAAGAAPTTRTIAVGTASISGLVIAQDTGRPIRNARVSLSGTAGPPRGDGEGGAIPKPAVNPPLANDNIAVTRTAFTNAQGRFTFDRLAAGRYSVSAGRDTYLSGGWGQKRVGGPSGSFLLTDGQRFTMSIPLQRGGVITGTVLDEDGEPVRAVQIQIWRLMMTSGNRRFQQVNNVSSDDRGMFRAYGLAPGDYRVAAMPRNNDQALAEQAQTENALIDSAIAAGQVRAGAAAGYPAYVTISSGGPRPQQNAGFLPVYAPSTVIAADATTIRVEANGEHGPFSIHLQYVKTATIHGIVSPPTSADLQTRVSLVSTETGSISNMLTPQANGEFTLRNVAPGRYRLFAQTSPRPQPVVNGTNVLMRASAGDASTTFWAEQDVIVEGQDVEAALSLRPSRTLSGVVISEAASSNWPRQAQLMMAPGSNTGAPNNVSPAQIDADGRFTFSGVVPGKYVLRVTPGTMKSSVIDGEDSLDIPFDFTGERDIADAVVTIMDATKRPVLWGVVTNAAGKAVGDVTIVIASTDERFWLVGSRRIVTMRTDPWGRYRTENLPPGSYYVATTTELEDSEQYDPELLRTVVARGSRVTLEETGTTRQDFRVR